MPLPVQKSIEIYLLHEIQMRGGSVAAGDARIYEAVANHFPLLTQQDRDLINVETGTNKWQNRVQWVRYNLVKKGELDGSQRGVWKITQKGRERLQSEWPPREPAQYSKTVYIDQPTSKKAKGAPVRRPAQDPVPPVSPPAQLPPTPVPAPHDPRVPGPSLEELISRHLENLRGQLADKMADLSAEKFEELVAQVLCAVGYSNVRRTGGPGDRNIDITGAYPAPFLQVSLRVQVKHRRAGPNVGPTDVAAFRDRAGGPDHMLLMVTNAEFTDGAKEIASEQGRQLVNLLDGKGLINRMVDRRIGVREGPMGILQIDEGFWSRF